jgi:hypothetical protein
MKARDVVRLLEADGWYLARAAAIISSSAEEHPRESRVEAMTRYLNRNRANRISFLGVLARSPGVRLHQRNVSSSGAAHARGNRVSPRRIA